MEKDRMKLQITIESPRGERVLVTAGTDAEAESIKAEAIAQGSRIVDEQIRRAQ
jgi:hypothetical protein